MSWFNFYLQKPLPQERIDQLKAYAGPNVSKDGLRISAGTNCAWLVVNYLQWLQWPVRRVQAPNLPPPFTGIPVIPGMRERVSGFEHPWPLYLLPWQQRLILNYGHMAAVRLQWPPGAGKTLGAIVWSFIPGGPVLFVTRSAARRTIRDDVKRFTTASWYILEGQKQQTIPEGTRVVITGWDTLAYHVDTLRNYGFVAMVFDEIHRASSHKQWDAIPVRDAEGKPVFDAATGKQAVEFSLKDNMAAAARLVSQAPTVVKRAGTTATPIPDRLRNLWGQLNLVEPAEWGYSPYPWFDRYCNGHKDKFDRYISSGRSSQPFIDELNQRLSFGLYAVPYSETHRNLPPKRRQVTYISKDELLKDEGAEARAGLRDAAKSGGDHAMAHARLAAAAARKRNAVVDLIADAPSGKMVVLTGLRKEAPKLAESLRKKMPEVTVWCATGEQTIAQRDTIREEYMAHPGPCILVGTNQSWGESLNLQDTDVAFIVMLPYRPGDVVQIEGRFSRQGQLRPTLIHYIIAEGTYDEQVADILLNKLPAVEHIVKDEELSGFGRSIAGLDNPEEVERLLLSKLIAGPGEDE